MKTQSISVETQKKLREVMKTISEITSDTTSQSLKNTSFVYYGTVSDREFNICNKKYGAHSNVPWIKGKISEADNKINIIIEADIEERMELISKMMYPFFIIFGSLIMILGGTIEETSLINSIVGACLIVFPFLYVPFSRRLLKSIQEEELKQFNAIVGVNNWTNRSDNE